MQGSRVSLHGPRMSLHGHRMCLQFRLFSFQLYGRHFGSWQQYLPAASLWPFPLVVQQPDLETVPRAATVFTRGPVTPHHPAKTQKMVGLAGQELRNQKTLCPFPPPPRIQNDLKVRSGYGLNHSGNTVRNKSILEKKFALKFVV
jgi:hypothetical protein